MLSVPRHKFWGTKGAFQLECCGRMVLTTSSTTVRGFPLIMSHPLFQRKQKGGTLYQRAKQHGVGVPVIGKVWHWTGFATVPKQMGGELVALDRWGWSRDFGDFGEGRGLQGKKIKNDFIKQTGFGLSFAEWWIYYISWWFQANYDGGNFLHVGSRHLPGSLPCEIQLDEVKSSQWSPSKHQGQTSRRHPAGPYLFCCFFLHLQTLQRILLNKRVRCALQAAVSDASSRHGH